MNKNFSLACILCFCAALPVFAQNKPIVYETLDGWLTVGTPVQFVIEKLGEPDSVGDIETWEMSGLDYRFYQYSHRGLSFYSELVDGFERVFDITVQTGSTFHTSRGISIGDSKMSVLQRYSDSIDDEHDDEQADISVINNIYEGTFFYYENGKVVEIEIGALAE